MVACVKLESGTRDDHPVPCTRPARWRVVFLLFADRREHGDHPPARGETTISVCDEHKATVKPADFISDEGWATICAGFKLANKAPPVRKATRLEFLPLE